MLNDPAVIFERRRIKRHLNFWRVFGVVALSIAAFSFVPRSDYGGFGDHVARLKVSGIILNDSARDTALRMAAKQKDIRALIVEINSHIQGSRGSFHFCLGFHQHKALIGH